ncbi:MAG TPA: alkaline phosphatase D family protein [Ramlibacter sp.]|jgi:alkaline phosphatase D|uniref:alkaline phosphatase D family protein n=1 Tax=Ramlibacter sp. TaxID=1917967 RepID=UPI002D575205|nr:alkaline phosphatase D family protein [Ramlibacter sp.]HZY18712.1 alkaline phosphatase D family protein [Ramlibacter sp.]
MQRRDLLASAAALAALSGCASPRTSDAPLRRIGFGSCMDQNRPQPVWDAVLAVRPDLFLFGGDNVYVDAPPSAQAFRRAYAQAAELPGLSRVRAAIPHLAIWDDHDFGLNDGGAEFPLRQLAKDEFLAFWKVPADDPRRRREGLYHAQVFGPPGRRVQGILLDDRWFRSPWRPTDRRDAPGRERYLPDPDPDKTLLGPLQWQWLEAQLREPAQVRLVLSGIQVLAEGHGWERWGNFPLERERLVRLVADTRAGGVVLLSGDRHFGAVYRRTDGVAYPLTELTASGFTHTWRGVREAGPNRIGEPFTELHFGLVDIDWDARALTLSLVDVQGRAARRHAIPFDELKITP